MLAFSPDYDQYYASLAASASASAAISTTATPAAMNYTIPDFSDTLEDDDMEDRKPNVQYLDSLGDYRKRSRSVEDEGKREAEKKAKLESAQTNGINGHIMNSLNGHSIGSSPLATVNGDEEMHGADVTMQVDEAATDDPIVHGMPIFLSSLDTCINRTIVNGKPVPFSQVTEEDQELMTPDEYTHYYEVMTAREA
jgi:transcription initiation factor TFIIE subunit alpha